MPRALAILSNILSSLLLLLDVAIDVVELPTLLVAHVLLLLHKLRTSYTSCLLFRTSNLQGAPPWKAVGGVRGVDTDEGSIMHHTQKIISLN